MTEHHELRLVVDERLSADRYGNAGVHVLATPAIAALVERVAMGIVRPRLPPGCVSVGTSLELHHLAATPVGMSITIRADLVEDEKKKMRFDVVVEDEYGVVARATHSRATLDSARFKRLVARRRR